MGIKNDPILKLAIVLEKIALKEKYFVEKKSSRKKTQISGLEWVTIQNFCERL